MIEYEELGKLNHSFFSDYEIAFKKFIHSGWYILGASVREFEKDFASYCGINHCLGLASGLDALKIALVALNLPKGSEVLVAANSYVASVLSIIDAGLTPVLIEPDPDTYNISVAEITKNIGPKTRAIMCVHLYGKLCAMREIMEIAKEKNLFVIEDAAQAHGATIAGQKAGTFGHINAFSFYPTKNLGALGDAGALTLADDELAERVKALRNYGSHQKYYNKYIGFNSRLDECQAAFLSIKLKKLDEINAHKKKLAAIYFKRLKSLPLKLPTIDPEYEDTFHIFNILTDRRDELKSFLLKNEIKTEVHYPLAPHEQECFKGFFTGKFPVTEKIHRQTLSLPISYIHSDDDIHKVCDQITRFFN